MRVTPLGKAVSRIVYEDQSVLFYLKCVGKYDLAGVAITASTATGGANAVTITTNAAVDTDVDAGGLVTYATEGTIQGCLNRINDAAGAADVTNVRYRASVGDFRPGWVVAAGSGLVPGAQNILLGEGVDGAGILAESTTLPVVDAMSVCIGGPRARAGTDPFTPDHFETDYTSTVAGVITPVRSQRRRREEQNSVLFQTIITSIHAGLAWNGNDLLIEVYDINDNLIWAYTLGVATDVPANVLDEDHPIVGPMGSPLFVEATGTGVFTNGPLAVRGYRAVA